MEISVKNECHACKGKKVIEGRACAACGGLGTRQGFLSLSDLAQRVEKLLREEHRGGQRD